jgi:molybdopterin-guanine dinucleotide biosynthesis protein
MQTDIQAVALTGTIGAGKTTLAEAVSEELHERGQRAESCTCSAEDGPGCSADTGLDPAEVNLSASDE